MNDRGGIAAGLGRLATRSARLPARLAGIAAAAHADAVAAGRRRGARLARRAAAAVVMALLGEQAGQQAGLLGARVASGGAGVAAAVTVIGHSRGSRIGASKPRGRQHQVRSVHGRSSSGRCLNNWDAVGSADDPVRRRAMPSRRVDPSIPARGLLASCRHSGASLLKTSAAENRLLERLPASVTNPSESRRIGAAPAVKPVTLSRDRSRPRTLVLRRRTRIIVVSGGDCPCGALRGNGL